MSQPVDQGEQPFSDHVGLHAVWRVLNIGGCQVKLVALTHNPRITRRQKRREGLEVEQGGLLTKPSWSLLHCPSMARIWRVRCLPNELVNQAVHDVLTGNPVRLGDAVPTAPASPMLRFNVSVVSRLFSR